MKLFNFLKKKENIKFDVNSSPMAFQFFSGTEPTNCKVKWKDVEKTLEMDEVIHFGEILVFPASEKFLYVTWPISSEDESEGYNKEISIPAINPTKSLSETVLKLKKDFV